MKNYINLKRKKKRRKKRRYNINSNCFMCLTYMLLLKRWHPEYVYKKIHSLSNIMNNYFLFLKLLIYFVCVLHIIDI